MKKYFLLVTAALALLAVSCNREQELNGPDSGKKTSVVDDSVPAPVLFTSHDVVVKSPTLTTKGLGAIDDWHGAAQKLYIYGFPFTRTGQGVDARETLALDNIFINNVAADAPVAASDADGIRLDNMQRTRIGVYNPAADGAINPDYLTEPFYYEENVNYSFFAYYVDDAVAGVPNPAVDAAAGTVTLSNLTLDGTQDIMLATTNKEIDARESSRWLDRTRDNNGLEDQILGEYVDPTTIYSAHAARRGVNPDLIFEHMLSRFTFHVWLGGTVKPSDIDIVGLDLIDWSTGDLTIVGGASGVDGRKLVPDETTLATALTDALADDLLDTPAGTFDDYIKTLRTEDDPAVVLGAAAPYQHPYNDMDAEGNKLYQKLGQSILAFPGRTKYDVVLKFNQLDVSTAHYHPYKLHLEVEIPKDANGMSVLAEKGKNYNVYITMYGLEDVKISVSLTEWENTDIFINPDENSDDAREAASILFGTNRPEVNNNLFDSGINDDTTKDYEVLDDVLAYPNPELVRGDLQLRINEKSFSLLDTLLLKAGVNPLPDVLDRLSGDVLTGALADSPVGYDDYTRVLAYVRSNSVGVFHFSSSDETVLKVDELTGLITPVATGSAVITVRQNSSNDFLPAVTRFIDVTIVDDNRIPVIINWNDKNGGAAPAEATLKIVDQEGHAIDIPMNATVTIGTSGNAPATFPTDPAYFLNYTVANGWVFKLKVKDDSPAVCGLTAQFEYIDPAVLAALQQFNLSFEVVKLVGGGDPDVEADWEADATTGVVRVDPKSGVITALKAGTTYVKVNLNNLEGDDTYIPAWKVIEVVVVLPVPEIKMDATKTLYYGQTWTIAPKLPAGAGVVTYTSADDTNVPVDANGTVTAAGIAADVDVTVSVAASTAYDANNETVVVTVEKATPKLVADNIIIGVADPAVFPAAYNCVVSNPYDKSGTYDYDGALAFASSDAGVFTVDAVTGEVTPVAAGRAVLTITAPATATFNEKVITVNVIVR